MNYPWMSKKPSKKRKLEEAMPEISDDDAPAVPFPFLFPKSSTTNVHTIHNRIYFNDDVTNESMSALNRELRTMDDKVTIINATYKMGSLPIYLYLTTNGGDIHAALSAVDCIKTLQNPVYTVVDGFVASAGTLLSLAGKKRFILPNAYMLIHELRSGVWGKMSELTEGYENLTKVMNHLIQFYAEHTPMKAKQLEKLLTKDSIWNAQECVERGVADSLYRS